MLPPACVICQGWTLDQSSKPLVSSVWFIPKSAVKIQLAITPTLKMSEKTFPSSDSKLKTTSLTFPSSTLRTAVSSSPDIWLPTGLLFTPHFSLWQARFAPAVEAPVSLVLVSHSREMEGDSCFCWLKWFWRGATGHRASSTVLSSSDTNAGCRMRLHNSVLRGGNRATFAPFTLYNLKCTTQLRLDFNLAHKPCLTCLAVYEGEVVCMCGCVCLWLSVCMRWNGVSHGGSGLSRPCSSAPACPQRGPCVHGKVTAPFQTAFSGSCKVWLCG